MTAIDEAYALVADELKATQRATKRAPSPAALHEAAGNLLDMIRDGGGGAYVEITASGTRAKIVDAFSLDDLAGELCADLIGLRP